jgi:hypothetical protein
MIDGADEATGTITSKGGRNMNDGKTSVSDIDRWRSGDLGLCVEEAELSCIARIETMCPWK